MDEANRLYLKGEFAQVLTLINTVRKEAIRTGDHDREVFTLTMMIDMNRATQNYTVGLAFLDELNSKLRPEDGRFKAMALNLKGAIYYELSKHDSALIFAKQSLRLSQKLNRKRLTSSNLNLIGACYKQTNQDSSLHYLNLAIEHYSATNDSDNLALGYINLSSTLGSLGRYKEMEEMSKKAIDLSFKSGIPVYASMGYGQLMDAYRGLKEIDLAFWAMSQRDSINFEVRNNQSQMEVSQLLKQIEDEKELIEDERNQLSELLDVRSNIIMATAISVILLLLTTIFLLIRNGRERKKNLNDMKNLNKEIIEYSDRLQELNDTKDKILSVISHDLRAPFAHLLTYLSFGNEGLSEADREQVNKELIQNTQNGLFMLDNLLYWANSQAHEGMHIDTKLFNLKLSTQTLITQLKETTNTKEIDIQNNCQSLNITTDEVLFQIVLRNLLSNAIKFSPMKSVIEVASGKFGNEVRIFVIDHGKGIKESIVKAVINVHGPISPDTGTEGERGAGLGLRLCLQFVKMLGGELLFEINPSGGTTAIFKLPINPK